MSSGSKCLPGKYLPDKSICGKMSKSRFGPSLKVPFDDLGMKMKISGAVVIVTDCYLKDAGFDSWVVLGILHK
jgi:hypothetical protein